MRSYQDHAVLRPLPSAQAMKDIGTTAKASASVGTAATASSPQEARRGLQAAFALAKISGGDDLRELCTALEAEIAQVACGRCCLHSMGALCDVGQIWEGMEVNSSWSKI